MSAILVANTALRSLLPAATANPAVLVGVSALLIATQIAVQVKKSGGVEEISLQQDGFKARFYPPKD